MKITVNPPTPPEPTYVLELTKDQLVALGVLSYRHEYVGGSGSTSFYRSLPWDIQSAVGGVSRRMAPDPATSNPPVDWTVDP